MKFKLLMLAYMAMVSSTALFADVAIPYGEGSGKADYINNKKYPKIDDPLPTGPLSFRVVKENIWVADSVGNKIMKFDKTGKLLSEFSVLPDGTKAYNIDEYKLPILNMLIDDFAPVRNEKGEVEAWWIIDSCKNRLVKFSIDGKKLAEIKHAEFGQLYRVEVGLGGHVFVADKIARSIFTFDEKGNFLNKQNWEWSGMAVSGAEDTLYRLMYDSEAKRNILVSSNIKGKVLKAKMIDCAIPLDPKLWWVDEEKGECVITYTPVEFKGNINIIRVGLDGKVRGSGELLIPRVMNRYIDTDNYGEVYLGKCDYFVAPEGNFEVVPYKLP